MFRLPTAEEIGAPIIPINEAVVGAQVVLGGATVVNLPSYCTCLGVMSNQTWFCRRAKDPQQNEYSIVDGRYVFSDDNSGHAVLIHIAGGHIDIPAPDLRPDQQPSYLSVRDVRRAVAVVRQVIRDLMILNDSTFIAQERKEPAREAHRRMARNALAEEISLLKWVENALAEKAHTVGEPAAKPAPWRPHFPNEAYHSAECRKQFESYAINHTFDITRGGYTDYVDLTTAKAWFAWCACWQFRGTPPRLPDSRQVRILAKIEDEWQVFVDWREVRPGEIIDATLPHIRVERRDLYVGPMA